MNPFGLFFAVLMGAFLLWGLATGQMPAKGAFDDRKHQPRFYWATATLYAAFMAFGIYSTFRQRVCSG